MGKETKTRNTMKISLFYEKYHCEIFMMLMFLFLGLYEFYYAYYASFYISPDSSNYLKEAMALLRGDGFHFLSEVGSEAWFSSWPVGYPALVALTSWISGRNVYLSSKLLAAILAGIGLAVLYLRFRKNAWMYSLIYLNAGFLGVYIFSWSENPFILFILIYTVALSEIVTVENPRRYWYFILGFGGVGAFLTRYFGLWTMIATGICIACYIIRYVHDYRKGQLEKKMKEKVIALIVTEVCMGIIMGGYLLMNKVMAGYTTGADRTRFSDDYKALTGNLFSALKSEAYNATNLAMISPMRDLTLEWNMVFAAVSLMLMAFLILKQLKKNIDYKVIFIGSGILYYIIFIFVRYHSTMDGFSNRFFSPGSLLISIGVIGFIVEHMDNIKKNACLIGTLFLAICCAFMLQTVSGFDKTEGAWAKFNSSISAELDEVPGKSIVLRYGSDTDTYRPTVVRPDVLFVYVNAGTKMDGIFDGYSYADYVYAKAGMVKDIQAHPENYDPSMAEFFKETVGAETADNEWIKISIKERRILSAPML